MATHIEEYGDAETVWYFGFGSNMKTSVIKSRGIEPLDVKAVKVPSYVLTFDVFGLPYSEPAMASIARYTTDDENNQRGANPPDVHGVAYLLSSADVRRLIGSEGGGVAYDEIIVTGVPLHGDDISISMCTLTARYLRRPNAAPSARYLGLLQEGAKEHGLPQEYQHYLQNLPCFSPGETFLSRLGAASFLWVGRRVVRTLARIVKRAVNEQGRCPLWYGSLIFGIYSTMWWWHDHVHTIIFSRGDGGGVQYGAIRLLS